MNVSEIMCTISFPPEVKTRQLEETSKKQIQDMCNHHDSIFPLPFGGTLVFLL